MAELVLGVAHTPFASRAGPAAGEELIRRVGEIIRDALGRRAFEQAIRRGAGQLGLDGLGEGDDLHAHARKISTLASPRISTRILQRWATTPPASRSMRTVTLRSKA